MTICASGLRTFQAMPIGRTSVLISARRLARSSGCRARYRQRLTITRERSVPPLSLVACSNAANPQRGLFYNISLETFVPEEHPLRAIRPLIDDARDPAGLPRSVRAHRPAVDPARAAVLGPGRRLSARRDQRAQAGHGAAVQHGPAVVRGPEPRRAAVGRLDLQPEPAAAV